MQDTLDFDFNIKDMLARASFAAREQTENTKQ